MHKRLTDSTVATITAPASSRLEVADAACPGLWLRVTPDNAKTFAIRYRINGRPARYTIGRYPSVDLKKARAMAHDLLDKVRDGGDPRHRKSDAVTIDKFLTVEYLVEMYLETLGRRNRGRKLKPSHVAEVKRRFTSEVIPVIGARPFSSIGRDAILRLLERIEERAPRVAGHVFYDLRVFYKWALQQGHVGSSPMDGLEPPAKPEPRERVLKPAEIKRIWITCSSALTAYNTIMRLLLLTGQRRGEVTGASWFEFDLEAGLWTIPKQRTKNGREHRLPLSQATLQILAVWRATQTPGADKLFPSKGPERESFSGFSRCKRRLDNQAGVSGWTVHDLRRTAATSMAEMAIAPHVIERILNHASGTMTPIARVYNRATYEAEMREALERWAHKLNPTIPFLEI